MASKARKRAPARPNFKRYGFNRGLFDQAKKTQRQVAKEIGIDEAYLSKVVRNQIEPGVLKAYAIASSLGVDAGQLYGPTQSSTGRLRQAHR